LVRIEGRSCNVFWHAFDPDGRDFAAFEDLQSLGFATVEWEDIGARGTIFDDFDTSDHFSRLESLRTFLSGALVNGTDDADELLVVLEDASPRLAATLGTTARAYDMDGDEVTAIARLTQAVALDSGFAMAWRKLASAYLVAGYAQASRDSALERAYHFRDRLTATERLLTTAAYFMYGPGQDRGKAHVWRTLSPYQPAASYFARSFALALRAEMIQQMLLCSTHTITSVRRFRRPMPTTAPSTDSGAGPGDEHRRLEDVPEIREVDPVLLDVRLALALVPVQSHDEYMLSIYRYRGRLLPRTRAAQHPAAGMHARHREYENEDLQPPRVLQWIVLVF
jgi:hypothetical protein